MISFEPACLPTALGSLPIVDPTEACRLMTQSFPAIPVWPQLPKRTYLENMYVQFSEGLPGGVLAEERVYVNSHQVDTALEALYTAISPKISMPAPSARPTRPGWRVFWS